MVQSTNVDRVRLDAVFFIYWIAAPSAMARNDNVLMQPLFPIVVRLLSPHLSLQGRGAQQSSLVIASHVSGVAIHNTVFAAANKFIITGSPRSLHSLAMTNLYAVHTQSLSLRERAHDIFSCHCEPRQWRGNPVV